MASKLPASITNFQITASVPSPQLLGTVVMFQASATGASDYQYSVQGPLDSSFHVVQDFNSNGGLNWAPIEHEGVYQIQVIARTKTTSDRVPQTISYTLTSRVTGNQPQINVTANPLVLLYSAPACPVGSTMSVQFALANQWWTTTSQKPCVNGLSMNFYIAGLQQNSVYYVQHVVYTGGVPQGGPVLAFPSGQAAIPAPLATVLAGPVPPSSAQQPLLLQSFISTKAQVLSYPTATDLYGNIVWYSPRDYRSGALARPVAGGTMLMIASLNTSAIDSHLLFEQDLAGNPIRETNASIVSEQLAARGLRPITFFTHEARRLPNGYTATLGSTEVVVSNVQGATGPVDIMGDTVVILDQDFQLVWAWSVFDHLDINRKATLPDDTCSNQNTNCPYLYTPVNGAANDWTHANAVDYSPVDGSLLVSLRAQDWILKIAYGDGSGDGHIVWRLGKGGDFKIVSLTGNPWFSHQHDANYESTSPEVIELVDNGNTRITNNNGVGSSRGQVLQIDETDHLAVLKLNANLGSYSPALGTAEKLLSGNYHFLVGASSIVQPQNQVQEFSGSKRIVYELQSNKYAYRAYRMQSLYAQ